MRFSTIAAAVSAPLLASALPLNKRQAADTDILVLQFAEVLERLETDFYQQALNKFVEEDFIAAGINVPDVAIQNFQGILEHEIAHTDFLNSALAVVGSGPVQGCSFSFGNALDDVATMAATARVVEAVGVGAYLGAGGLVQDKNILMAAASILTIEARHQTILNAVNGASSVPQAFDIALSPPQVLAIAGGFISGCSLGIEPNPTLTITNDGVVQPGTLLTFDSPALAGAGGDVSCQMLVGGEANALSFPIAECVVPEGINGPVAIYLTTDPAPLSSNLVAQEQQTPILAGPTIAFIDTQPDALGALIREGTGPVDSTEQITPDQAQELLNGANGQITDPALDPAAPPQQVTDPALDPAAGQVTDPALDPAAPPAGQVTDPALNPAVPENAGAAPPAGAVPDVRVLPPTTVPL